MSAQAACFQSRAHRGFDHAATPGRRTSRTERGRVRAMLDSGRTSARSRPRRWGCSEVPVAHLELCLCLCRAIGSSLLSGERAHSSGSYVLFHPITHHNSHGTLSRNIVVRTDNFSSFVSTLLVLLVPRRVSNPECCGALASLSPTPFRYTLYPSSHAIVAFVLYRKSAITLYPVG